MHIEKNVFENIFNTVMDVKGKTKNNIKARLDLALFYNWKNMWGLYCWEDLNIYLVLFRTSFENENQLCSTTWW